MNASDLLTLRGYVQLLPMLSGKEEAARVVIITDDGQEYSILHKGEGIDLLKSINANVEVSGSFAESGVDAEENGAPTKFFVVKSYRLTDGFDDPWYDDAIG